jgi:hypothetical protein
MRSKIVKKLYGGLIAANLISFTLLPPLIVDAESEQLGKRKEQVQQINLDDERQPIMLKGTLQPYSRHIYRFRGRVGQEMIIRLDIQKERSERDGEVVFWVQSNGWYPPGRSTALLEGNDKGGITDWSGKLPGTGEYEIYVSNPPISDRAVRRSLRYKLEITVK